MKLKDQNEVPVWAKTTMAEEDRKFNEEETVKLIKFLEQNPDLLKSSSKNVRLQLKEQLRDHLGKFLTFSRE